MTKSIRVLDLFSGTGSVGKTLRKLLPQAEVVSVDIEESFAPTIVADILALDYKSLWAPGEFDAVWMSPPCTAYSIARNSVPRDFAMSDKMVKRGFEIIDYLKPRLFVCENPRGFLRLRPFMRKRNKELMKTVSYCMYSSPGDVYKYPKPTDIWTNASFEPRLCRTGNRCRWAAKTDTHPVTAQRGTSNLVGPDGTTTLVKGMVTAEAVYRVPRKLISILFDHLAA
jgi:C-5 cytosine-specific DNA methylase